MTAPTEPLSPPLPPSSPSSPSLAPTASPTARALTAARDGDWALAETILTELVGGVFDVRVEELRISRDRYSLNSLNGLLRIHPDREFFFKFHHEEGEELTLEEFYRGELLKTAGYPVDVPVYVSRAVGRQVLLYARRTSQRLADACERLDFAPLDDAAPLLDAQGSLDTLTQDIYTRTLHVAAAADAAREPIHQLFHHRLVSREHPERIGGRAGRFFWNRRFDLAGTVEDAAALRSATWSLNGIPYADSLGALLERSKKLLEPARIARFGAVTAHGDSHNANLWWEADAAPGARLVFFDPAFAGTQVSALIAEVKATFHNVFAHPLWLYDAARADSRYRVTSCRHGERIEIDTDWALSPLRMRFLELKTARLWRPLLALLAQRGLLAADWRATLRCALFCCPALVMDLCAGGAAGHTPKTSALGLAVAMSLGSEPERGHVDVVTRFMDAIDPARH